MLIMKIAISSDNHLDVNRQDPDEIVSLQANYLNEQNVEYYLLLEICLMIFKRQRIILKN